MIRNYDAFTLAEVLITLVIVGVIAAMTIPTLMNNTNKQEYVSRLKKTYSTLSQATNRILAEEGTPKADIGGWGTTANAVYEMYKKYLSKAKECDSSTGCFSGTYRYKTKAAITFNGSSNTLILADGAQITMNPSNAVFKADCTHNGSGTYNLCQHFLVDVNGAKGPNTVGQDTFAFSLKENGLVPTGCDFDDCKNNSLGWGCTCKVLREGAINY